MGFPAAAATADSLAGEPGSESGRPDRAGELIALRVGDDEFEVAFEEESVPCRRIGTVPGELPCESAVTPYGKRSPGSRENAPSSPSAMCGRARRPARIRAWRPIPGPSAKDR